MAFATKRIELTFLISTRVPSGAVSDGRTETLASQRRLPFSMSPSQTPVYRTQPPQLRQVGRGLLGRAEIGLADDLDERHAGAVPVHQRHVGRDVRVGRVVEDLARVLLEVDAHQADRFSPRGRVDLDRVRRSRTAGRTA